VAHRSAHGDVRSANDHPDGDEHDDPATVGPSEPEQPRPDHEPGHNRGVLLGEQPEHRRRRAPGDALMNDSRIDREDREQRSHRLRAPDDVRHRLHVYWMDGEQESRGQGAGVIGPAPGERRHGHGGRRMPRQIHRVKPGRAVDCPIDRKRRDREWSVHRAPEIGGPIGRGESLPEPRQMTHERVHHDDRHVVESEPVPQSPEIHDCGAGRDHDVEVGRARFGSSEGRSHRAHRDGRSVRHAASSFRPAAGK